MSDVEDYAMKAWKDALKRRWKGQRWWPINISTLGKILHVNILKTYKRRVIIKKSDKSDTQPICWN